MQVQVTLTSPEEFVSFFEFMQNRNNPNPKPLNAYVAAPSPEPAASHAAAVAALGAPVSAPAAPDPAPVAAPQPAPAQSSDLLDIPPIPTPAPAPKTVSRADVQSKAIALVDAGKKEVLQGLLRKFGVLALPNIPDEQLTAFMAALEEVA